jgi:hypothetical protein
MAKNKEVADTDDTERDQSRTRGLIPFKPGQSGNPKGRPKNARSVVSNKFLNSVMEDYEEFGPAALQKAREDDPMGYIRMVASLLPKEIVVARRENEDMSDDELRREIAALEGEYKDITGQAVSDIASTDSPEGRDDDTRH